jgi:HD-like signal output (HDOD) protein
MLESSDEMKGPNQGGDEGPPDSACQVSAGDLKRLEAIHSLLEALRDPLASSKLVEHRVKQIPVLTARMIRFAKRGAPARNITTLGGALAIVGNRGLETVLLELLEDLTVLRADIDDARKRS